MDEELLRDALNFIKESQREFAVKVLPLENIQCIEFLPSIHRDAKSVYPTCFKDFKFEASIELFDNINAVHRCCMWRDRYEVYKPYNNYLKHEMKPVNKVDVYASEIDLLGNIDLTVEHKFNPELKAVINTKVKSLHEVCYNMSLVRQCSNFSSIFTMFVPEMGITSRGFLVQHLQKITPQLALGTELSIGGDRNNSVSISGRFSNDGNILSTTLSSKGTQFCFYKQLSQYFKVASILDIELETKKMVASMAYQIDGESSKLKVCYDSEQNAGFYLEKYLWQSRDEFKDEQEWFKVILSAVKKNNKGYLGIGLQINL